MQSKAKTVDAYLKEVPIERREVVTQIRDAFLRNLKGYEECMEYGGPCYKRNGKIEAGFMSQVRSINIYILKQDVMKKNKDLLKGLSVGKGCIRFPNPRKIDLKLVAKILSDTLKSKDGICT
jgi:uncharacterized protein YdhG (YjbR/CyaY superfamily)